MGRILLAVVLSCGSLVAQKMLLADDRERQVAVFAVPDLAGDQAAIAAPAGAGRFPGVERASLAEIADLLGSRARPGDHVDQSMLGDGRLNMGRLPGQDGPQVVGQQPEGFSSLKQVFRGPQASTSQDGGRRGDVSATHGLRQLGLSGAKQVGSSACG